MSISRYDHIAVCIVLVQSEADTDAKSKVSGEQPLICIHVCRYVLDVRIYDFYLYTERWMAVV
jgi:hypothetical protein